MGRYNPDIHHRRSIRFKEYDYSKRGAYLVTICTHQRIARFGEIVDGILNVNERGAIVQEIWNTLPNRFPGIDIDAFIVMPNHVHGILIRSEEIELPSEVSTSLQARGQTRGTLRDYRVDPHRRQTLSEIVRTFKGASTYTIRKSGMSEFAWQRDFHEHIIRNQQQLDYIRSYIVNNPQTWLNDTFHPDMISPDKREGM